MIGSFFFSLVSRHAPSWRLEEQITFIYQLATYLHARVPLLETLMLLHSHYTKGVAFRVTTTLLSSVQAGESLSSGLAKHARHFHPLTIALVRIGEQSGSLPECLMDVVARLRSHQAMRRNLIGACTYPLIIIVATAGIVSFLLIYVLPNILPLLEGMGTDIPLPTKMLIAFSSFMGAWWWVCVLLGIILSILSILIRSNPLVVTVRSTLLLRTPFFGKMLRTYTVAHITHTLVLLLRHHTPLPETLALCAATTGNNLYAQKLMGAVAAIEAGVFLSVYLEQHPYLFDTSFTHILAVGERTGSTADVLAQLHQQYRTEFEQTSARLLALIEPLLMLCMGSLVGGIALAIIMPVYQLSQSLHQ